MKRRVLQLFIGAMLLMFAVPLQATNYKNGDFFDYSYQDIRYHMQIISTSDKTVRFVADSKYGVTKLSGVATLPSRIHVNNEVYSVAEIGNGAFEGNKELVGIEIPNTVHTISSNAFKNCTKLAYINGTDNVIAVYSEAFAHCKSLNHVSFSTTRPMASMRSDAFFNCENLKTIKIVNSTNENGYYVKDSVLFQNTLQGSILVCYPAGVEGNTIMIDEMPFYVIPEEVTTIDRYAFCNTKLQNVYLSPNTRLINENAFYSNWALRTYAFPWALEELSLKNINENFLVRDERVRRSDVQDGGQGNAYIPYGTRAAFPKKISNKLRLFEENMIEFSIKIDGYYLHWSELDRITSINGSYDRKRHILTLTDGNKKCVSNMGIEFLDCDGTIRLDGDATITCEGTCLSVNNQTVTITGSGTLTLVNTDANVPTVLFSNSGVLNHLDGTLNLTGAGNVIDGDILSTFNADGGSGSIQSTNENSCLMFHVQFQLGNSHIETPYGAYYRNFGQVTNIGNITFYDKNGVAITGGPVTYRQGAVTEVAEGVTIGHETVSDQVKPYLTSGTLTWDDATKTLTLENAVIDAPNTEGIHLPEGEVTVNTIGHNVINAYYRGLVAEDNLIVTGSGTLTINTDYEGMQLRPMKTWTLENNGVELNCGKVCISAKLPSEMEVEDAFLEVKCPLKLTNQGYSILVENVIVTDNRDMYTTGMVIAEPMGVYAHNGRLVLNQTNEDGNTVEWKPISKVSIIEYPLTYAGVRVNNYNACWIDENVSYDSEKKQLTLNGVSREFISRDQSLVTAEDDLTIYTARESSLTLDFKGSENNHLYAPVAIAEGKTLRFTGKELLTLNGKYCVGICAAENACVKFVDATIEVFGKQMWAINGSRLSLEIIHSDMNLYGASGNYVIQGLKQGFIDYAALTDGGELNNQLKFVNAEGKEYKGNMATTRVSPPIWIAGNRLDCSNPAEGVWFDFENERLTFDNANITNAYGPALEISLNETGEDDEMLSNLRSLLTDIRFNGYNRLQGTTAGVAYTVNNMEQEMKFSPLHEGDYPTIHITATDGPAWLFSGKMESARQAALMFFQDCNVNLKGKGAVTTKEEIYTQTFEEDNEEYDICMVNSCMGFKNSNVILTSTDGEVPTVSNVTYMDTENCDFMPKDGLAVAFDYDQYAVVYKATGTPVYGEFIISRGDEVPEIDGIKSVAGNSVIQPQGIFDLQGRRIDASQMKKGLYIINGKKIMK